MEEWRDIKGYEGLYQVSTMGRVKSIRYNNKKILKQKKNQGYLQIMLCRHGEHKTLFVHRIVAETFLENPDNLPQVNHKNEIKSDNRVENLEWVSIKYNINYGTGIKRRSATQINGLQSKPVYQYSIDGQFIKEYPSIREIERQLGYDHSSIGKCCNGKLKTAYGYKWSYNKQKTG